MKKALILITLITLPVVSFGQNTDNDTLKQNAVITYEPVPPASEKENHIASSTFTKTDVTNLSYKKSIELISIKAYRKSLQIRTKEVKSC